ncbi:OprD family outer membrane porin [Pseudomonas sp. GG8]
MKYFITLSLQTRSPACSFAGPRPPSAVALAVSTPSYAILSTTAAPAWKPATCTSTATSAPWTSAEQLKRDEWAQGLILNVQSGYTAGTCSGSR